MIRQVLQLGGAEALVPGVILPVAPCAVPTVVGGESLDQGGIGPGMGVQGLFDVVDKGAAAFLRQADSHQTPLCQHTAGTEPVGADAGEHLLCQRQLLHSQGAGLVKLSLIVLPKGGQAGIAGVGQRGKFRVGIIPAELVDVVALAAVFPPGKGRRKRPTPLFGKDSPSRAAR